MPKVYSSVQENANSRLILELHISHVMRKPALAICEQQKHKSASASTQSDSTFVTRCLDSIIPLVSINEILSL